MVSKAMAQAAEEVSEYFGEKDKKKAQANPEAYILAMLLAIKDRLPNVSATLSMTIERASYDSYLKEAKKRLEQNK